MIKLLKKKLTTAVRVYRTQGINKIWFLVDRKVRYYFAAITLPFRKGVITVDNCSFDLNDPLITSDAKIALFAGQYEEYERPAIRRLIPRNLPVIELGAGMGVVSCITNRLLINPSAHLVVEANPHITKLAEQNRTHNGCQFTIVNAALGYSTAELTLYIDEAYFVFSSTKKTSGKPVTVKTMRLKQLIEQLNAPIVSLICDIEGMEVDLVENELDVISNHVGVFLFEEHSMNVGHEAIEKLFHQLETNEFEKIHHAGDVYVYINRRIFSYEAEMAKQNTFLS